MVQGKGDDDGQDEGERDVKFQRLLPEGLQKLTVPEAGSRFFLDFRQGHPAQKPRRHPEIEKKNQEKQEGERSKHQVAVKQLLPEIETVA